MLTETGLYLGPARVLECEAARVKLSLPDRHAWAVLALATFYEPRPDDLVLATGQGEEYWVIGVIRGSGKTVLNAPGDLELRAAGSIGLVGGREVRVESPKIALRGGKIEVVARALLERLGRAARWVRETFQLRAGRVRAVVAGDHRVQADRIVGIATKDVRLDGERINLG